MPRRLRIWGVFALGLTPLAWQIFFLSFSRRVRRGERSGESLALRTDQTLGPQEGSEGESEGEGERAGVELVGVELVDSELAE